MKMIVNIKNTLNNTYNYLWVCVGGGCLFFINKGFARIFNNIKDYEIN